MPHARRGWIKILTQLFPPGFGTMIMMDGQIFLSADMIITAPLHLLPRRRNLAAQWKNIVRCIYTEITTTEHLPMLQNRRDWTDRCLPWVPISVMLTMTAGSTCTSAQEIRISNP